MGSDYSTSHSMCCTSASLESNVEEINLGVSLHKQMLQNTDNLASYRTQEETTMHTHRDDVKLSARTQELTIIPEISQIDIPHELLSPKKLFQELVDKYELTSVLQPKPQFQKIYEDGIYSGEALNELPNGYGEYLKSDSYFVGNWKNGVKCGFGFLLSIKKDNQKYKLYKGNFCQDKFEGQGTIIWSDKKLYEGNFVSGHREGYGVIDWPNGRKYRGKWKNGKKHGKGHLEFEAGVILSGRWEKGKPKGLFIIDNSKKYSPFEENKT